MTGQDRQEAAECERVAGVYDRQAYRATQDGDAARAAGLHELAAREREEADRIRRGTA